MLTPNWNPDTRTLRQFSVLWVVFFAGMGAYRAWRGGAFEGIPVAFSGPWLAPLVLWGIAIAIGLPGVLSPRVARPVYVGMTLISFPIGWVVSHLLLAVVYFGMFAIIGAIFRLMGRDHLALRPDKGRATYWKDWPPTPKAAQYFRLS